MSRSTYKPEYARQLIIHMKEGLSFKAFGGVIEKSERTLHYWCEAHPDFLEAKEIGECCSLLHWERAGQGGRDTNAVLWIVNMCNRFGWRQRPREDLGEPEGKPKESQVPLSNDDLVRIIKAARGEMSPPIPKNGVAS